MEERLHVRLTESGVRYEWAVQEVPLGIPYDILPRIVELPTHKEIKIEVRTNNLVHEAIQPNSPDGRLCILMEDH